MPTDTFHSIALHRRASLSLFKLAGIIPALGLIVLCLRLQCGRRADARTNS